MEKVIYVPLLLLLLGVECNSVPKPQSYSWSPNSTVSSHISATVSNIPQYENRNSGVKPVLDIDQGASNTPNPPYNQFENTNFEFGGDLPTRVGDRPRTTRWPLSQSGTPQTAATDYHTPTTVSEQGWKKTGGKDSMRAPTDEPPKTDNVPRPSSPVPPLSGGDCHPSEHIKYDTPGTKHPNTDISKTFCCSHRMNEPSRSDAGEEPSENPRIINNDLRQFALDLLINLAEGEVDKNLIVSPFSVWNVLLMMLEGAKPNSKTANEIRSTLYLHNVTLAKIQANFRTLECSLREASKHATFVSANALFYDTNRPAKPDYVRTVENKYQSDVIGLNFQNKDKAVRTVNDWVGNKTQNRIQKLLQRGGLADTNLILANAILFKGRWNNPFNASATTKADFYNEKKQVISSVDMMFQRGDFLYSFIQEINAHVLDIPYVGSHFRMLIILPKYNGTLIRSLKAMKKFPVDSCYERLVQEQEMYSDEEVRVSLPRFKVKSDLQLKETLRQLGISDIFTQNADLSKISSTDELYLSKLVHAAEIEVNEEGTVASGVTGGLFGNKSKPPNFVANRPFAYFIVENNLKTVIFAGKVIDPSKK